MSRGSGDTPRDRLEDIKRAYAEVLQSDRDGVPLIVEGGEFRWLVAEVERLRGRIDLLEMPHGGPYGEWHVRATQGEGKRSP